MREFCTVQEYVLMWGNNHITLQAKLTNIYNFTDDTAILKKTYKFPEIHKVEVNQINNPIEDFLI